MSRGYPKVPILGLQKGFICPLEAFAFLLKNSTHVVRKD